MSNSLKHNDLRSNWGWLLALGILFVLLGFIGLGMTIGLTLVSMIFFGVLLLIAGVTQLLDTFQSRQWKGALWHIAIAILYLVAGLIFINDPFIASTFLTAMIACLLIIIGILRATMAVALRDLKNWGWLFFAGLVAIILGVLILVQWPISGLWVIGLFIAIELIFNGWSYIFLSMAMRERNAK